VRKSRIISGEKYGHLLALHPAGLNRRSQRQWLFKCDCGKEVEVTESSILAGTKSCSCFRFLCRNMHVGDTYGRLTALENLGYRDRSKGYTWRFKCSCGGYIETYAYRVKAGIVKSCGCLLREHLARLGQKKRERGLGASNRQWSAYRIRAERRQIPFDLSREQFRRAVSEPCFYCGLPPQQLARSYSKTGTRSVCFASGLDRVNSDLGYTVGNVVDCCKKCNMAKNDMTPEEFGEWLECVYAHWKAK